MKFEVKSGKLILSDPCYEYPTWCQGIVNAKNGMWVTEVIQENGRIASIMAFHKGTAITMPKLKDKLFNAPALPFIGGVDSGQFGYFDFDFYRNDKSVEGLPSWDYLIMGDGDIFYSVCCHITLNNLYGVLPNGFVSCSGYGDGSYTTFGLADKNGDYYALITHFIYSDVDWDESENDDADEDEEMI